MIKPDDWQFDALSFAFFLAIALSPQLVITVASLGRAGKISKTGMTVMRSLGAFFAAWSAISLLVRAIP